MLNQIQQDLRCTRGGFMARTHTGALSAQARRNDSAGEGRQKRTGAGKGNSLVEVLEPAPGGSLSWEGRVRRPPIFPPPGALATTSFVALHREAFVAPKFAVIRGQGEERHPHIQNM